MFMSRFRQALSNNVAGSGLSSSTSSFLSPLIQVVPSPFSYRLDGLDEIGKKAPELDVTLQQSEEIILNGDNITVFDELGYLCVNRSPGARIPKPANRGKRGVCNVMRRLRKRMQTGRGRH